MTNILKEEDFYRSCDLALVTTITLSFPIEAIDSQNPKKSYFLFKRSKELDLLIESYWHDALKVSPQAYFNQLRIIKARLYE